MEGGFERWCIIRGWGLIGVFLGGGRGGGGLTCNTRVEGSNMRRRRVIRV